MTLLDDGNRPRLGRFTGRHAGLINSGPHHPQTGGKPERFHRGMEENFSLQEPVQMRQVPQ